MKSIKVIDGGRRRCLACGHPSREHRADECTVPKCSCPAYANPETKA